FTKPRDTKKAAPLLRSLFVLIPQTLFPSPPKVGILTQKEKKKKPRFSQKIKKHPPLGETIPPPPPPPPPAK
ncbi:hypothetical protein M5Z35_07170, partial [Neisseria meningitidis]|nr:hypothetical protein [Neisseria meningitidis]